MKILGALLLLVSFTAYGATLSFSLANRVKKIEHLLYYITALGEEIRLTGAELPLILSRLPHKGEYIKDGQWYGLDGLKTREKEIADDFLRALGTTDTEGQLKNISLHKSALTDILAEAREEKNKLSRLYVSLFFLGGLFTVVLIV